MQVLNPRVWSLQRRLSTYYMVMYGAMGLTGPFLAPWLHSRGVDPAMIGVIVAAPSLAMALSSVYLGGLADRLSDWRTAIIAADWLVLLLFAWLLVRQQLADILVIWTLAGLLIATKTPVLDAATISLARRRDFEYARLRALGSAGFVIALLLAGTVFDAAGLTLFVPVLVGGALLRALWSLLLPRFREPDPPTIDDVAEKLAMPAANLGAAAGNITSATPTLVRTELARGLRHPGFLMVLLGSALISASHGFWGAFGMVNWIERGIPAFTSSLIWCSAVLAEIVLMWFFTGLAGRLSARYCLVVAGLTGLLRWGCMTTAPSVPWLFALQALHALSFGLLFIATVYFIARRVDDAVAARAQALSATITTALLALSTLASGALYQAIGVQGYWLMGGMCLAGMGLVLASFLTHMVEYPTSLP